MAFASIGQRTLAAWDWEIMRTEACDQAHAHRAAYRTHRFRGEREAADLALADALNAEVRAGRYHRRAQDVRATPIGVAT